MSGISLKEVGGSLVIDVPEEQTLIGRGNFLQVTDKRVSRSHAILDVIDRKLYITPNHTNPCFLRSQGTEGSTILTKDVKQMLEHGDSFGLLPEQLYYKVAYPQVNGKERDADKADDKSKDTKEEKKEKSDISEENGIDKAKDADEDWDEAADDQALDKSDSDVKSEKDQDEEDNSAKSKKDDATEKKKEVKTKIGNVALPLDKKRPLPAWMVRAASVSPKKDKPTPTKKPTSVAVNKKVPGPKKTNVKDFDDDSGEEDDSFEAKPVVRKAAARYDDDDDEDFDEHISDDDYVPEPTTKRGGRAKRKRTYNSESDDEDDFSDDDDDDDDYYAPKKKKPKTPKKSPKGKGKKGAKGKKKAPVSPRKTPSRRKKKSHSDDEDDDVPLPRRGNFSDDDDDDDDGSRRPQRAARQKRGSYVDDPMIEEALEDFASEGDDVNEEKDSDFDLDGVDDSGSDWDKKKKHSPKQKVQRPARGKGSAKKGGKKKAPRRPSRTKDYSDDDEDDDVMEDDEPYVPRPSKRRGGGGLSQQSEESGDEKRRRRREPCQYGEKCYRKNPVHFRTYCHPGDSSYDEDDDKPTSKDSSKKDKDSSKATTEKPSRPQRSTAGTRLVTQGSLVDDDLPDTYDYNDSFIDDGTQPSDDSAKDSDYDAEQDVRGLGRDAKKFIKNKKMTKPVHD